MHTRDNKLKIYQDHVHHNLRKYLFANRVRPICTWNSLPDSVIEANSVDTFNKKAVLPQGNRAMPRVFFSVEVRQQHSLQV